MNYGFQGVGRDLGGDLVMFESFGKKFKIIQFRGTIRTEESTSAIPDPPTRSL